MTFMRTTLLVIFLIACIGYAGGRKVHFGAKESVDPKELDRVIDDVYSRLDDGQAFNNANYRQSGTGMTNAAGFDTIYLAQKYANASYLPTVTPTTVSLVAASVISDSSFIVALWDHAGSGHSVSYYWQTQGDR